MKCTAHTVALLACLMLASAPALAQSDSPPNDPAPAPATDVPAPRPVADPNAPITLTLSEIQIVVDSAIAKDRAEFAVQRAQSTYRKIQEQAVHKAASP
jgi:hypothetical protein